MQVNIYEAKAKLSELLDLATKGEDIIIARSGRPMARLIPIAAPALSRSGVRFGGLPVSKLKLSEDFHAPLSDDDLLS